MTGQSNAHQKNFTPEQEELAKKVLRAKCQYEILGIPRNAEEPDIKRAYKKLALKLHPDKNTAPSAEDAFKKVSQAASVLTDEQSRAYYDRTGSVDGPSANAPQRGPGGMHQEVDPFEFFRQAGLFGGGPGVFFGGGGPFGFQYMNGQPPGTGQRGQNQFFHGRRAGWQQGQARQQRPQQPPTDPDTDRDSDGVTELLQPILVMVAIFVWMISPQFFFLLLFLWQMAQRVRHIGD